MGARHGWQYASKHVSSHEGMCLIWLLNLSGHIYLSSVWLGAQKKLDYAQNMLAILNSLVNIIREIWWSFDDHKNIHFDNELYIHTSFNNYEGSGYDLDLGLLRSRLWFHIFGEGQHVSGSHRSLWLCSSWSLSLSPRRTRLVGKTNHFKTHPLKLED